MKEFTDLIKLTLHDVALFAESVSGLRLRAYQKQVAWSVAASVLNRQGLAFVVIFPRQSGKNELQAQIENYLLTLFSQREAEIVKVSPTWKPQSQNAMRRLERILKRNWMIHSAWKKESGYIYRVGTARITFLSGAPEANIVGATASILLEVDEAQDVSTVKYDKEIAPMAASTNATRVFWGTAWTSQTLLAREYRAAREAEQMDGKPRTFLLNADQVAAEVPAYGRYVHERVERLGRNHPLVRTQFYSEEIEALGGMFPERRLELMRGSHPYQAGPELGKIYAMTVDVAGVDEAVRQVWEGLAAPGLAAGNRSVGNRNELANPARDATALTIFEVDLQNERPIFRVVNRRLWVGTPHAALYGELVDLAEQWSARWLVIDATGVGAGLASFLSQALPGRVIPFLFTQKSKSDLGWAFLALVENGQYQEYRPGETVVPGVTVVPGGAVVPSFWRETAACQSEILDGPGKILRWGVPVGMRDPVSGDWLHDDLLVSAALCAALAEQPWGRAESAVSPCRDPLSDLSF